MINKRRYHHDCFLAYHRQSKLHEVPVFQIRYLKQWAMLESRKKFTHINVLHTQFTVAKIDQNARDRERWSWHTCDTRKCRLVGLGEPCRYSSALVKLGRWLQRQNPRWTRWRWSGRYHRSSKKKFQVTANRKGTRRTYNSSAATHGRVSLLSPRVSVKFSSRYTKLTDQLVIDGDLESLSFGGREERTGVSWGV